MTLPSTVTLNPFTSPEFLRHMAQVAALLNAQRPVLHPAIPQIVTILSPSLGSPIELTRISLPYESRSNRPDLSRKH